MSHIGDHQHAGRIPLTVIGGFLGSGKTTLLNRMLQSADGRRLAVLVNDFGAINIDAALVSSRGADVMTLSNGCVCCQIGGDLTDALIRVIESTPRPDAIVIEASGVSDPWRIAQVGIADPALALESVLVLLDVCTVREHAADLLLLDTVQRQLHAADLLVLNQCDRVDDDELGAVRAWLDEVLPDTPRFETAFGQLPATLLGGSFPKSTRTLSSCEPGCAAHGHDQDQDHDHANYADRADHADHADHGDIFDSWSTTSADDYDADALRVLLRAMPRGVLRMKGVLRTSTHGWSVLQFAGRHGSLRPWPADQPPPDKGTDNAIVAIGLRGRLPVAQLAGALDAARMSRSVSV